MGLSNGTESPPHKKRAKTASDFSDYKDAIANPVKKDAAAGILLQSIGEDESGTSYVFLYFDSHEAAKKASSIFKDYRKTCSDDALLCLIGFLSDVLTPAKGPRSVTALVELHGVEKDNVPWSDLPVPVKSKDIPAGQMTRLGSVVSDCPLVAFFVIYNYT